MTKQKKPEPEPTIFTYYDDESTGTTEFRRLARNVRHSGNPSEVKSILVTSAMKHEGKSIISANLAIAIARRESNRKVLLMDCDLRRPTIHSLFGIEKEPGFASLLAGGVEPNEVAQDTVLGNLKVIPSGQSPLNSPFDKGGLGGISPSQLLARAKDVLDRCKEQFDILVCDAPPVVPVDDVGLLGPYMDGVLLVVMAGKTDRMVVKRAVDILSDVRAKVLGIVLNNLHGTLPYYYDYKYYRYKYEQF